MVEPRFAFVFLMVLVALVALPVLVQAVNYNVGVKAGDWIKYGQYKITWVGNGTEPSYIIDQEKIDWMRVEVENVSGTIVTLNSTTHYNNGTLTLYGGSVDVASGFIPTWLIASNLKSGDPIFNSTSNLRYTPPTINQTTTGIYSGAVRSVNLLEVTSVYDNQTETIRICWDQSTGVMVEMYVKVPMSSGAYIESSVKATETNMWNPDFVGTLYNNLVYVIAGIAIIIVVMVGTIVLRRRKTPLASKQETINIPPPPEQAILLGYQASYNS